MKTVQGDDGTTYIVLKQSDKASLVRDPKTGNECYVQNDRLEPIEEHPLETIALEIPDSVRLLLKAVHDDQSLGLLLELTDRGPLPVTSILDSYDLCESELHGRLSELTAAGLIEETEVSGVRGYRVTESCRTALNTIRMPIPSNRSERKTEQKPDTEA